MNQPRTEGTEAVAAVAEALRPRLLASAQRVLGDPQEAEDVVQDVVLRALQEDDLRSASGWLFAATYRRAIDRLRARRRRPAGSPDLEPAAPRGRGIADGEQASRLRAAVGDLDDPYRTAVRLRYLDGLSFGEVAARMDAKERTARTWVGRGLSQLRQRLGGSA